MWNVRSTFRAAAITTVLRKLSRYNLDLMGVQGVRWEGGGTKPAAEYTFFYRQENKNHELRVVTGFFEHKKIMSAFMMVQFASDRMSYIIVGGHAFHIIVLNIHAPTEDKIDYVKDSVCEGTGTCV
jgi:hypothetical protein